MKIPKIIFTPCRGDSRNEAEENRILCELTPPYVASKNMPDWWRDLPLEEPHPDSGFPIHTAKGCPGIFDFMRSGYIIPAWSDFMFKYESENIDRWLVHRAKAIKDHVQWSPHTKGQIRGCPISHTESETFPMPSCDNFVKITTPYYIDIDAEDPENYSVMFIQPFYRASPYFSLLPGMLDPFVNDVSNKEINLFLQLNIPDTDIHIKRGDPLVQVIPFKRQDFSFKVQDDYDDNIYNNYKKLQFLKGTKIIKDFDKYLAENRSTKNKNYDR